MKRKKERKGYNEKEIIGREKSTDKGKYIVKAVGQPLK